MKPDYKAVSVLVEFVLARLWYRRVGRRGVAEVAVRERERVLRRIHRENEQAPISAAACYALAAWEQRQRRRCLCCWFASSRRMPCNLPGELRPGDRSHDVRFLAAALGVRRGSSRLDFSLFSWVKSWSVQSVGSSSFQLTLILECAQFVQTEVLSYSWLTNSWCRFREFSCRVSRP